MEKKVCEGVVYRCTQCGKQWDDDGCSVLVVPDVAYSVEYFLCSNCSAKEVNE